MLCHQVAAPPVTQPAERQTTAERTMMGRRWTLRCVMFGVVFACTLLAALAVPAAVGMDAAVAQAQPPQPLLALATALPPAVGTCLAAESTQQQGTAVWSPSSAASGGQHDTSGQLDEHPERHSREEYDNSPSPQPARRERVPRGQPPAVHVTTEQCEWLTDTVDDSMRWLLHQEQQRIDDDNAFPRIWCGCIVICSLSSGF